MQIAVFDVDGTLVDSNYQHALAWSRAFRQFGITLPTWEIHRHIGMGGDQLVAALAGDAVEDEHGDSLRDAWSEQFAPMADEVVPLADAHRLLAEVRRRGFRLVLASSGTAEQVRHYLDLLDAHDLVEAWTTSDDVESSKPAPDLLEVAIDKVGSSSNRRGAATGGAVMVGDSTWDLIAARKIDVPSIAVLTGGFSEAELREAGAAQVFHNLGDFADGLDGRLWTARADRDQSRAAAGSSPTSSADRCHSWRARRSSVPCRETPDSRRFA